MVATNYKQVKFDLIFDRIYNEILSVGFSRLRS